MDYPTLLSTIASTLHRTDLTDSIPTWVKLFEASFNRKARFQRQLTIVQAKAATVDPADVTLDVAGVDTQLFQTTSLIQLPEDYLSLDRVVVDGVSLELISREEHSRLYGASRETAAPKHYRIDGDKLLIAPALGGIQVAMIYYYQALPELSESSTTNWLLKAAPDLYLYGSMLHAPLYIEDYDKLAVIQQYVTSAWDELVLSEKHHVTPKSRIRSRSSYNA